ncbi:MAG TPA: glycosyltransferase [Armatimonadota bacterium]|jgi:hypothetical protein
MNAILDILFLVSVAIIWFMIGYQFILTLFGYVLYLKSARERDEILRNPPEYPDVTILVPAHNEAVVIEGTVRSLLRLEYPADKLHLLVIDDASTDHTGEILDRLAAADARVSVMHRRPPEGGKGKSAALNAGWQAVTSEIIAVYDADNRPEPDALKLLVAHLVRHPKLGAALGKFRTGNKDRNILTRFINIEGLSFQWIVQAGRWQLLGIATLPGTNFIIRRSVLEQLNGWDVEALTEDSELSIRIYQAGYQIAFVPYSVTWEQEPETFQVWLKQRTRWVRGNNYVIAKLMGSLWKSKSKVLAIEMMYTLSLYYLFLLAIVLSHVIFILGLCHVNAISVYGPYTLVWIIAFFLYVFEIFLALTYDGEATGKNLLATLCMYFTYCQGWLLVVFRAFYADYIRREQRVWDKTVRFDEMNEAAKNSDVTR